MTHLHVCSTSNEFTKGERYSNLFQDIKDVVKYVRFKNLATK